MKTAAGHMTVIELRPLSCLYTVQLSLNFENTTVSGPEGGVAELCVVLDFSIPASINRTASVLVELTFADGTASSGKHYIYVFALSNKLT